MTRHRILALWRKIVGPPSAITESRERRQAQLLSSLIVYMVPLGIVATVTQYLLVTSDQPLSAAGVMILMLIIAISMVLLYLVSRSKHFSAAAWLAIHGSSVGVVVSVLIHHPPLNSETLLFLILPVILAGTFLSLRLAVLETLINLGLIICVGLFDRELTLAQIIRGPFSIVMLSSVALILSFRSRDLLEEDRQAELSEREARYRGLLESAFEAVAVHRDGVIRDHNTGFATLFGYGPEEPRDMSVYDFLAPGARESIEHAIHINTTHPFETLGRRKDGRLFHIEMLMRSQYVGGQTVQITAVRDISPRKEAEAQLRRSLSEKEVLLREIHHRVKNNLQIISSLLSLQATAIGDPQTSLPLQDSQNRIRSMALIHEQLYRSRDLTRINLSPYIRELASQLVQTYQLNADRVVLETTVQEDLYLDIDTAIPCGLIVNELVSNAFKHAFPDGKQGRISIELCQDTAGSVLLAVADTGIGFPEGLDFRNTASLGLQLVGSLAHQLNGSISLHSRAGTRFEVKFAAPLKESRMSNAQ